MKRMIGVLAAAGCIVLALPMAASAAPADQRIHSSRHWVEKQALWYDNATGETSPATDGSKINWNRAHGDSPLDRNDRALRALVMPGTADGSSYAVLSTEWSRNLDRPVGTMKNLSFDLLTDTADSGGAPRISVEFLNGDVAYLASSTCKRTLTSDPRWSRADFTGMKHDCSINVTGDTGGLYEADGDRSAWQVYADANPDQRVSQTYMVWDVAGDYITDHIALGGLWAYGLDNRHGVMCRNMESRC